MAKKLKTLRQRMADGTMPPPAEFKSPEECIAAYESGFEGAIYDPDGAEEVEAQPDGVFSDAAHKYGIADSGKGKLILSYASCWEVSGRDDWFHGYISQPTGDCVSRSQSHSAILALANAVKNGNGSWPDIPDFAYKTGMPFHPSGTYWEKKGGISGWSCSSAAARSKDKTGLVLAVSYPENPKLGDLLLKYNTNVIGKWCKTGAPDDVVQTLNKHCTLTYSRSNTSKKEEIMDAIANGYGVSTCGGQGYGKGSSARNSDGYCKRSGSWSHALAIVGYDDTEFAHQKYGGTLFLILNSWAGYLGSSRPHPQGNTKYPGIPKGSFWCTASSFSGRDSYILSSVAGYPPQKLKNWALRDLI